MPAGEKILVVDDERRLREFLAVTLRSAGYDVALAADGTDLDPNTADLVVMDVSMPGRTGLEVLRDMRTAGSHTPVIMLTACDDDDSKLAAFEAGADDYLTKPFNARELVARVGAVLRRAQHTREPESSPIVAVGELTLTPSNHAVTVSGRSVNLTRTEYDLLLTLARGAGRVFTPAELLSRVWGPEFSEQAEILRTNMYRLRQKLETDPRQPRHLRTRPGIGYYLAA
jgi:DNA-binding response OmpR family regulator